MSIYTIRIANFAVGCNYAHIVEEESKVFYTTMSGGKKAPEREVTKKDEEDSSAMKKEQDEDEEEEEEEYEIVEVEEKELEPRTIETGDSVKVKQVMDDATIELVMEKCGYDANFAAENIKLMLMFVSCVFAMVAQFYPAPFPDNRPILGVCCAAYFILSSVLQFIITYIDVDLVMTTLDKKEYTGDDKKTFKSLPAIVVRTDFPKYQEWFTLKVHYATDKNDANVNKKISVAKMYVGKYFTEEGEFLEEVYAKDLQTHIKRFEEGRYGDIKYDHKAD